MKLLIVDDSLLVRNTLKRFFKAVTVENLSLMEGNNGEAALQLFESEQPDYMILDLIMPVMDGMAVLKHLQHVPHRCDITILSSNIQQAVKAKCLELGAKRFIEKPINAEKFTSYLETIMGADANCINRQRINQ
jgi:CheY-like chemotaxis protein